MELRSTAMELLPLVCLCLLTWSGTTFADGNEPKIIGVTEGSDVTLPCSLSSRESIELKRFEWRKDGQKDVFLFDGGSRFTSGQDPQFKGRVSHFKDELKNGNASITIRDTKLTDSGNYTCDFPGRQETSHIQLVVGAAPKPFIRILGETKDGELVQCEVSGASPKPLVQWKDSSGNILPAKDPQVSERGGRYDITLQTTVTETGNYTCVSTQEEINHQIYSETFVRVNGAPQLHMSVVYGLKAGVQLQCDVQGASPQPNVHWKDSDGNILPAEKSQVSEEGGHYRITLQATVTETKRYHCVVTQEKTNRQTEASVFVNGAGVQLHGSDDVSRKVMIGLIAAVLAELL
ncbi:butyrophilin-like protein 1 isoform X4 [Lates calcarifer]|uniref:Butyrophilin-like protein 1 isoform X3 n=1 Tax=Lates calcarifer TaxID=8187 RepID=A0AAJ8B1J3_LATCA|nr:butyrophilin-like protein 1 isoform X3 [Lates calcarifer]XP_050924005.1 butyrophilin-like protein 1 isoform X4 [Lates calcarifer]